jgi:aminoglycoside phosphotransferase (APT) family kinase protein
MVLLHNDFGSFNMLVDEKSCNLLGVVDWAEAEIAPFGINLYAHDRLISKIHLKHGWSRYNDYRLLDEIFWSTFSQETEVDNKTIKTIKAARIARVLL